MGVFGGLHELAESLVQFLRAQSPVLATHTNYGHPPGEPIVTGSELALLTLLWVTPQPTHRNDPPSRNAAGVVQMPPLTLSAYVMLSTYGGGAMDPAIAYELLGLVLRIFHEQPVIALPVAGLGEGEITVTHVPTAADLMEKIFSPIQLRHRPFAIFEVGPVQIRPLVPPVPDAPPVRPGGVHLEVTVAPPPSIVRITPDRQVAGGAVRVELALSGATLGVIAIGGVTATTTAIPGTNAFHVVVPPGTAGEVTAVAAQTSPLPGRWTDREVLGVLPAAAASIDAPSVASVSITAPSFVLIGRGLGGATRAIAWPDEGVPGESDARELVITTTPTSATILGTELDAKLSGSPPHRSLLGTPLRLAVRLPSGSFTPYVLIEVTP